MVLNKITITRKDDIMRAHITYKGDLYWVEEGEDGQPILIKAEFTRPSEMQEKTKLLSKEIVA